MAAATGLGTGPARLAARAADVRASPAAAPPACGGTFAPRLAGAACRGARRLPAKLAGERAARFSCAAGVAGSGPPGDFDFSPFGLVVSREYAVTLQRDKALGAASKRARATQGLAAKGARAQCGAATRPGRAAARAEARHRCVPPAGIVFTQREDRIVVAEVQAGTQAAATGLVHAGDVLKRTSAVFGSELWAATDFRRTMCGQRRSARGARSQRRVLPWRLVR